jgi:hypothetical protein
MAETQRADLLHLMRQLFYDTQAHYHGLGPSP